MVSHSGNIDVDFKVSVELEWILVSASAGPMSLRHRSIFLSVDLN